MKTLDELMSEAVRDLQRVAELAGAEIARDEIKIEIMAKPHEAPKSLPVGHAAVYAFFLNGQALKVGVAGPKTAARYMSQHYHPRSSQSNLAKSILINPSKVNCETPTDQAVGDWIKKCTDRVNILLPAKTNPLVLKLIESFLHVRWNPIFEGRLESGQAILTA